MRSERFDQEELRLAEQILFYSRRRITSAAPMMLVPIYALRARPRQEPGPLSTDGTNAWFCPSQVIADFQKEHDAPARQLLHVTLHCLLGHLGSRPGLKRLPLFDALAGWKIELTAAAIAGKKLHARDRQADMEIDPWLKRRLETESLPALYRGGMTERWERGQLYKTASHLRVDDHNEWAGVRPQEPGPGQEGADGGKEDRREDGAGQGAAPGAGGQGEAPDWESMRAELCRNGKGDLAGILRAELEAGEENGISYAAFLKRFAFPRERLLTDPDSFDVRWYHLGLELYGNMPLIEPSELSEPPVPDDLVIALDTSGSCSGDVCRRFLRETLNLLEDITAGASSFHILLLQCDTEVQQELVLETADQVERLPEDFTPRGFGGTDFRPVFQRIDELRQNGELPRMRGLLYLSDAFGDFPDKAPDYPAAFLIPQDEDCDWEPRVPSWVTKLMLNTDRYTVKEEC